MLDIPALCTQTQISCVGVTPLRQSWSYAAAMSAEQHVKVSKSDLNVANREPAV